MNGISNHLRVSESQLDIKKTAPATAQNSFQNILNNTIEQQSRVQFSKHAHMRLNARSISLTGDQLARVENGIDKANEKGIRDSLVLVDNVALVVNVKSKTVITAMHQDSDNVFSHIDGAVIV